MGREHYFLGEGVGSITVRILKPKNKNTRQFFTHFWEIYCVLFITPQILSIIKGSQSLIIAQEHVKCSWFECPHCNNYQNFTVMLSDVS